MMKFRFWVYLAFGLLTGCGKDTPAKPRYIRSLEIAALPQKTTYLLGEPLDLHGLKVRYVYSDGSTRDTEDYKVFRGDSFTSGKSEITLSSGSEEYTAGFAIDVKNVLMDTGLPVIYINTQNSAPVVSKEDYLKMNVRITSDKPEYSLDHNGFEDEIRGRGNATWDSPKKPYRIKFDKKTSLFGLAAAKSWVLLADYRSPTLLQNILGFELGKRFGLPFTHNFRHVEVVLNRNYAGTYILTEQVQTGKGRVDIDEKKGFLLELDFHYDDEVKFRTELFDLPVLVKSPEDITAESLNAIKEELNALEVAVNNGSYADLIDVDNLIDYIMVNDMIMNFELQVPASVYMYKEVNSKIKMGPLWDFDCGYGYEDDGKSFYREFTGRIPYLSRRNGSGGQPFLVRLFDDPAFKKRYKERWNEKYGLMAGMPAYIDSMSAVLEKARELNYRRWYSDSRNKESAPLKAWWNSRLTHLNEAVNRD